LLSKNTIKIESSIVLPVVVYGCKTWSLTMMEEESLRTFKNMMLRKIYGPKGDEIKR